MHTIPAPTLTFKTGLVLCKPNESGQYWLLEDTEQHRFFRLGIAEAKLLSFWMSNGDPRKITDPRLEWNDGAAVEQDASESLVGWLAQQGLIETNQPKPVDASKAQAGRSILRVLSSAFYFKLPICNPDRWIERFTSKLGWLFDWRVLLTGVLAFIVFFGATCLKWDQFYNSYNDFLSPWRWLWMFIAWVVLKAIHETAHAVACKRYNGEIREAGLAMILFAPIAYVNVTSGWRFSSKWKRLHVTLAGVAAELAAAAGALLVWNWSANLTVQQTSADIVLLVVASSLLFNLNPLLKFDGYYALADITGVDNLYQYGQSYASYFVNRWILGLRVDSPTLPSQRWSWIKWYGIAAACYRVVTVSGLLLAAAALLQGVGIIIAISGGISLVGIPLVRKSISIWRLRTDSDLHLLRLLSRVGGLAGLIAAPLWLIPADLAFTVPGVVEYDPPAVIRAGTSGFVREVFVVDGSKVSTGEILLILENRELELRRADLKKQLAHAEQELLAAQWRGDSSEVHNAVNEHRGIEQQLTEIENEMECLIVKASTDGILVSRKFRQLLGSYVTEGDELAVVGNENRKRLKLSIDQERVSRSQQWLNKPMKINVPGRSAIWTSNARLMTRASRNPTEQSLLCTNGGPLAVVMQPNGEPQLADPRVDATVPLTEQQSTLLRTGQLVYANIDCRAATIGQVAVQYVRELIAN